jgi:hypothetical protein
MQLAMIVKREGNREKTRKAVMEGLLKLYADVRSYEPDPNLDRFLDETEEFILVVGPTKEVYPSLAQKD